MKVAIVVQRYGVDVGGGSENLARQYAHFLSDQHDVKILTTCARDYVTWKNAYPAGIEADGPVTVQRFPVVRERDPLAFFRLEQRVKADLSNEELQREWFRLNGPESPALLDAIRQDKDAFDCFLFVAFRYYHSFFGLQEVAEKSVLIPTAEDDIVLQFSLLPEFFRQARGFLFITPEERQSITRVMGTLDQPHATPSVAVEAPPARSEERERKLLAEHGIPPSFAYYQGRIDPNKGSPELFRLFMRYSVMADKPVPLVLAGKSVLSIPEHALIQYLGYVSDELGAALRRQCLVFLQPSALESLSIAVLEAWDAERPVLVNGRCRAMRGQVLRANGGLYYETRDEFERCLDYLARHPDEADQFGEQGRRYVETNYRRQVVKEKLLGFLEEVFR